MALFPDLPETELVSWVERGWVRPEGTEPDWIFAEVDVARVRLIYDFGRAMAAPEETMPLVQSLLDQVYTLRGQMRATARANGGPAGGGAGRDPGSDPGVS